MSMDYYANYANVVEQSTVEQYVHVEYTSFMEQLDKLELTFDDFCRDIEYGADDCDVTDAEWKQLCDLMDDVAKQFEQVTGIKLFVSYHEAEGRGCEVSGGFFEASNMRVPNPVIEDKFHSVIHRATYVTYG